MTIRDTDTERQTKESAGEQAASTSRRDFLKATATAGALTASVGSNVVGTSTAASSGIPTPWLHRDGNLIKDPMGNEIILRGVNMADPKRLNRTAPARGKTAEQVVEAATNGENGWHSRFIRIPVQPWDIAELPPVPMAWNMSNPPDSFVKVGDSQGYYEPPLFTADELETYIEKHLKPVVQKCVENDVYCIVDYHRHWGKGELAWAVGDQYGNPVGPNPKLDEEVRTFWKTMAPHFADVPNVLFEVYNEPTKPGWGPEEKIWKGWKSVAQPWVDIIRERAPRNFILIGNPRWSRMPWGINIEEFDGDNLGYTYHVYPGHAVTDYDDDTGNAWEKAPLFVTEWGYEQTDRAGKWISGNSKRMGEPFKQWAEERPVHWTAWCFDPVWLPAMMGRAFDTGGSADAIGDPYSGEIPEYCSDLPCEWETLDRDGDYAGEFVRQWLEERRNDSVPRVDFDPEPPEVPPDLSVEGTSQTSLDVSWDATNDPGDSPLAGYNVYLDGEKYTTMSPDATAATLSDLLSDTTYEVGVTGFDVAGNEGEAATVTATTEAFDDSTPPGVPSAPSVTEKSHVSLTVSWDGVTDTGPSGLHHYNVYVDGVVDQHVPVGTTEATISDVAPDTSYDVAVSAVDTSQNESHRSDVLTARTEVDRPGEDALVLFDFADGDGWPDSNEHGQWIGYSGFTAEHADGRLTLSWSGNGWIGCKVPAAVSDYQYLKLRLRGQSGGEGSNLSLDFAGVTGPLADYGSVGSEMSLVTVDLQAAGATLSDPGQFRLNAAGSGTVELDAVWLDNDAAGSGPTDTTAPSEPSDLAVESSPTPTLSWSASTDAGTGVDHYTISVDGEKFQGVAGGTTEVSLSGLSSGTHEFAVSAVDGAGNESSAATLSETIEPSGGSPVAPAVRVDGISKTSVTLAWSVPMVDAPGPVPIPKADHFNVFVDGSKVEELSEKSTTIADLSPGTAYVFGVQSVSADGATSAITTVTATTGSDEGPVAEINGVMPQDTDGDGLYEDLNGNDRLDSDDVVTYFQHKDDPAITNHTAAYDFNGNGRIDFDDIASLFDEL